MKKYCIVSSSVNIHGNNIKVNNKSKISNEVERIDNFLTLSRKLSFLPTDLDIFDIWQHYISILFIFQRLIC